MKDIFKKKKQKGYALLFTIMIISVISVITAGLISASTKQLILSSLAKDSQVAFYQADTGADCALYFDLTKTDEEITNMVSNMAIVSCGGINNLQFSPMPSSDEVHIYELTPPLDVQFLNDPCFYIIFEKTISSTNIKVKGYNMCSAEKLNVDIGNPRAVLREIEINY